MRLSIEQPPIMCDRREHAVRHASPVRYPTVSRTASALGSVCYAMIAMAEMVGIADPANRVVTESGEFMCNVSSV